MFCMVGKLLTNMIVKGFCRGWECVGAGLPSAKTPATCSENVPAGSTWMPGCIAGMPMLGFFHVLVTPTQVCISIYIYIIRIHMYIYI